MPPLTPWFSGSTLPVRHGLYDVRTSSGLEQRADFARIGNRTGWWLPSDERGAAPIPLPDVREWRGLSAPAE